MDRTHRRAGCQGRSHGRKKSVRRLSDKDMECDTLSRYQNVLNAPTSSSNYACQYTSDVNMDPSKIALIAKTNQPLLTLSRCCISLVLCNDNTKNLSQSLSSSPKSDQSLSLPDICEQACSISTTDDYEMNVDSPDSGFYSTTPNGSSTTDYYDETSRNDIFGVLSKTSVSRSSNCDVEDNRLCLIPPKLDPPVSKKEPVAIYCKWKKCSISFPTTRDLHDHVDFEHVDLVNERFACLWSDCKVYDKPAKSMDWLKQHIAVHTGEKRFKIKIRSCKHSPDASTRVSLTNLTVPIVEQIQDIQHVDSYSPVIELHGGFDASTNCLIEGCDASFSSQKGLARHVPSHFSEVKFPKARLHFHNGRRFPVKRRRKQCERKGLANIHDCIDQRTLDMLLGSLVKRMLPNSSSTMLPAEKKVVCDPKDVKDFDSDHRLASNLRFIKGTTVTNDKYRDEILFFTEPKPRRRKMEKLH